MTSRQQASTFKLKKGVLGVALAGAGFIGGMSVSTGGWDIPMARAQSPSAIDKVVQLNKKAMEDLDLADFDSAKKELLEAVSFGSKNGLESHPVMARTYVHLGALYVVGLKDKAKGQEYFGKALELQGDIKLDKNLKDNKDLQKAFSAAAASNAAAPAKAEAPAPAQPSAPAGDDEDADLPANIVALDCPAHDDTPPGKAVTLRCAAAANLKIASVALFYKGAGMDAYEELAMEKNAKGWWVAEVPKKRVDGKSLQFFFEGRDASDKPVVSNGRAESPLIMLITSNGGQPSKAIRHEDEDPLSFGDEEGGLGIGRLNTNYGNRRAWLGISVGTGGGLAWNRLEARSDVAPIKGLAFAGAGHLAPEIGIMLTPNLSFAVQGRLQYIPQNSLSAKVAGRGAISALGKLSYYTAQSKNRLFFTIEGGGGEGFRFSYIPSDSKNKNLNDTIHAGNFLAGAGTGFLHEFGPHFMWVFEINVLGGFPDFGMVADVSTGFHFGGGSTKRKAAKDMDAAATSIDELDDDK